MVMRINRWVRGSVLLVGVRASAGACTFEKCRHRRALGVMEVPLHVPAAQTSILLFCRLPQSVWCQLDTSKSRRCALYCSRASGLLPVPALCKSADTGGLRVSVGLAFMSLRDLTCGCSRLQMRCKGIWRRRWALPLCLLLWRPLLMLMSSPRSCVVGPAERPAHVSADGSSHEAI